MVSTRVHVLVDRASAICRVSANAETLLGTSPQELVGDALGRWLPALIEDEGAPSHEELVETDSAQVELRRRDGSCVSVLASETRGLGDGARLITLQRDPDPPELTSLLVEASPMGVAVLDTELRYLMVNAEWRESYELGDQPLVGRSHDEVFPNLPERWKSIHQRVLQGETLEEDKDIFHRQHGNIDDTTWKCVPWRRSDGTIGGIVMYTRVLTRREAVELALRSTLSRFQAIFDSTVQLTGLLNPDGTVLEANQTALNFAGVRHENIVDLPFWETPWWPEEQRPELRRAIERARCGELVRYETRVRDISGALVPMDFTLKPVMNDAGNVVMLIPELRDIVAQVETKRQLEQARERLENYLELIDVMIIGLDTRGQITLLNRRALEILDHASDTPLLGESWFERCIPEAQREAVRAVFTKLLDAPDDSARRHTNDVLRSDGSTRTIRWSNALLYDASGVVMGTLSSGEDITELELARRERDASEAMVQAVFNRGGLGMALLDAEGQMIEVNETLETMLGYDQDDILDMRFVDIVHPDHEPLLSEHLSGLRAEASQRISLDLRCHHAQGAELWLHVSMSTVKSDAPRGPRQHVAILRDITDKKLQDRELVALNSDLERRVRERAALLEKLLGLQTRGLSTIVTDAKGRIEASDPGLLEASDRDSLEARLAELLETGGPSGTWTTTLEEKTWEVSTTCLENSAKERRIAWHLIPAKSIQSTVQAALEEFFDDADVLVLRLDSRDRFRHVNDTGLETLGYSEGELEGRPFCELVDVTMRRHCEELLRALREDPCTRTVELCVRSRRGLRVWLKGSMTSLFEGGQHVLTRAVLTNATPRRQADALVDVIRSAQAEFIINSTPKRILFDRLLSRILNLTESEYGFIGEVREDEQGRYLKNQAMTNISWNEKTRRLYHSWALQDLEFRNLSTLFGTAITTGETVIANNPEDDPRSGGGLPQGHPPLHTFLGMPFFKGETCVGMIGLANRPGGYDEALSGFLEPLLTTCANLVVAQRTEAAQKSSLRALAESEARQRAVIRTVPDGILTVCHRGLILSANPSAAALLGTDPERLVDTPLEDHFDRLPDITTWARDRDSLRESRVAWLEGLGVRQDGERFPLEITAVVLDDTSAEEGFLILFRDITARKAHEAEMEQSRRELEIANAALAQASTLKDEFLASMSHELRTPLSAVLNLSEALQEAVYGELTASQLETVQMIRESGRHLLELINDILDLSKIEAGEAVLEKRPTKILEIAQASVLFVRREIKKRRQLFTLSMQPDDLVFNVDPRRLKQILVNLLSNAVKFTPEGGRLGLRVEGDVEADVVRFTVWDEGIGITEEDQARLFTPFIQLDSRLSRRFAGTGLGLSLVERLTAQHGGQVEVESTLGEGSAFTVTLPWGQTSDAPPAIDSLQSGTELTITDPLQQALTIEDRLVDAEHITRCLDEIGIANVVHTRAEGAAELALKLQPDIILLDVFLPDGAGWDVLERLKADPTTRHIPVTIVSISDERTRAAELGAHGYIVKPFGAQRLRAELDRVVSLVESDLEQALLVTREETLPHVLLADDNALNVRTYSDFLRSRGLRVSVATNGLEAIEHAHHLEPDLILMDIQMPELDGLEATRRLRDSDFTRPIVALTALAMPGDQERCLSAGADDYLAKPVSLSDLIECIQRHVTPPDSA